MRAFTRMTAGVWIAAIAMAQSAPTPRLDGLAWRSIGPAATGGRIADIAVAQFPGEPAAIYAAATTGGIFKSVNEGISWTPIFDRAATTQSIGAIAVSPSDPSIVWAGTGEADNRQSSSWGEGIYKSYDGGATWKHLGLEATRHIGRIAVHPTDRNIVYVAAVGHLWGSNPERGVYKTTDGGLSWSPVLFKDDSTGAIDVAIDPQHPDTVFAALYQRQRKGWGFNGGGPGSGIYRSTDGGAHWSELHGGLPDGEKGRIGLAISPTDSRIVYAVVEAGAPGASKPAGGVFRSTDGGDHWEHMAPVNPRPSYYSRIYADPADSTRVYLMGSNRGFLTSSDSGKSFRDIFSNVHSEDHAMWIDPRNPNRLVIGGDGGISISFDRGLTWLFRLNLPLGQFYNIAVNNQDPFLVCGGLQDNGSWCTPSASHMAYGISFKDAFNIGGGDGMQTVFSDDRTVFVSSQYGETGRLDLDTLEEQWIAPVRPVDRNAPAYRWYWTTPLIVSAFDPQVVYTGANVLFRSGDRGVSWREISGDLTAHIDREKLTMMGATVGPHALSRHEGQANFGALTVVAESPLDARVLYTGADDGTLHITRDGGAHWTPLSVPGLPPMLNISAIEPSRFAAGRVYLTVDGHFNDDYRAYVFASEDFGATWRAISDGLPEASVHRIREHARNANLLVAGTESGAFASFDRGAHWVSLNTNLPPVPVYDLVFQDRDQSLVVGTHGRGIWVLDHIEALAEWNPRAAREGALFSIPTARHEHRYNGQFWFGAGEYFAPNPPTGATLTYYLPSAVEELTIAITDAAGKTVRTLHGPVFAGMNRTSWDLRRAAALSSGAGPRVLPGAYTVTLRAHGLAPLTREVNVLPDPRVNVTPAESGAHYTAVMSAYSLQEQVRPVRDRMQTLSHQLEPLGEHLPSKHTTGAIGDELARVNADIARSLEAATRLEQTIDNYAGAPTAAQSRELDAAWDDAVRAATELNRILRDEMPPIYATAGANAAWEPVALVAVPTRPK